MKWKTNFFKPIKNKNNKAIINYDNNINERKKYCSFNYMDKLELKKKPA